MEGAAGPCLGRPPALLPILRESGSTLVVVLLLTLIMSTSDCLVAMGGSGACVGVCAAVRLGPDHVAPSADLRMW